MSSMFPFLKEVARGKKGSRDLTYEEAYEAAELIADGKVSPAQIGAFLIAERMKGESSEEITAFTRVFRKRSKTLTIPGGLDCAGAYDGRAHSFFATIPAAAVLRSSGIPVIFHGSETLPPKYGVVLQEVIDCLGGKRAWTGGDPLYYLPAEELCRPLGALRPTRQELGVRTILNHVEKWLNLGGTQSIIYGVFHLTAMNLSCEVMRNLGFQRGLVVQGVDGSEDIPTNRVSRAILIDGERTEEIQIDPTALGLFRPLVKERIPAAEQVKLIRRTLEGEATDFQPMVLLNSAVRLWLMKKAESIGEGIEIARNKLVSGEAAQAMPPC